MQAFIDFLVNNYLWFLIISLILIFALIGYLVDTSEVTKSDGVEKDGKEISKSTATLEQQNLNNSSALNMSETEVLDDIK